MPWNPVKFFLLAILLVACWMIGLHHCVDFSTLHRVAQLLHENPDSVYDPAGHPGRWFYGPVSLVFIRPLGWLPFEPARLVWLGIQSLAFAGFWILLTRLFPFLAGKIDGLWLLVWAISINALHTNFQSGNIQVLLVVMLLGAEVLAQRPKPTATAEIATGMLSALAAAIKVFPLLLVAYYWLLRGSRVRLGILVGFALAAVLPVAAFGLEQGSRFFAGFITNVTSYNADNPLYIAPDMQSLPSLIVRWSVLLTGARHVAVEKAAPLVSLVLGAGFLALAWARVRRTPYDIGWWSLALALCALLNPSTRPHYLVFYMPAFCVLIASFRSASPLASRLALVLSAAITLSCTHSVLGKTLNLRAELLNLPTVGIVILCAGLVALNRNREVPSCSN